MTDQITIWGKQTSSQITLTQTGFSQSQTETAQDAEGTQRPEGHSGQESSWLLGQGVPEQSPKGGGKAGRVMRKAHGAEGAAMQRPCKREMCSAFSKSDLKGMGICVYPVKDLTPDLKFPPSCNLASCSPF